MRLNFSNATPAMIREGVARLAAIVRRQLPSGLDRRSFPRVVA
jgi:DNA-binding transcriptional MocR family regulator